MPAILFTLVLVLLCSPAWAIEPAAQQAPTYSAASIVNSASFQPDAISPNSLITITGKNLAFATRALLPGDMQGDTLPTTLGLTGVRVYFNGLSGHILYVSPTQINCLVPAILKAGTVKVVVLRNGLAGPEVQIKLRSEAPGVFQGDANTLLAQHLDGAAVTSGNPARPGESLILYATGLGATVPPQVYGNIAHEVSYVAHQPDFQVLLNQLAIDKQYVSYVGITPGYAGLYQVNLRLPDDVGPDPEILVQIGANTSPAGLHLPVQP
jgi:uncharacterized protein (TIGR03437 family)